MKKQIFYMTFIALLSGCNCYKGNILQIEEQGSFAVGGTVLTDLPRRPCLCILSETG